MALITYSGIENHAKDDYPEVIDHSARGSLWQRSIILRR